MKKVLCVVVVLLLLCAASFYGANLNKKTMEEAYNNAITLIENCSYEDALAELEKANLNHFDRQKFMNALKYGNLTNPYKNTVPLYTYALAQLEYNSEGRDMDTVNEYLELISEDYSGELSEEIQTFRENFSVQYNELLEEQRRERLENLRIYQQEKAERLNNVVPYVGMSESRINETSLGTNYEVVRSYAYKNGRKISANVYRFKNGKKTVFVAECLDGRVESVSDYRDTTRSGGNTSTSKKKQKDSDPYNVNDYSNEEDFYDDNYDDFWDYEDAEDYYNEHHD